MSTSEECAKHAEYMRRWTFKNKERLNAERRERRKNDPEYREKLRVRSKKNYYALSVESKRAYRRLWREEHREYKNAKSREYYHDNIEKEHARSKIKSERRKQKRIQAYIAEHGVPPPQPPETPGLTGKARARALANLANRRYRIKNRERLLEKSRIDRKNHPEKGLVHLRNRRARKRNIPGTHTLEEWQVLCAKYDNRCVCCGKREVLEADHVIPVTSPKSTNHISNIQPLCGTCNKSKMKKTIDYRPLWGNKIMWCNHIED